MLLIGSFLVLVFRGLSIALEGPTLFARLLAGSVTLIFFTYAFVNMGMVSGLLPVVGVPLPFISYGGSALLIDLFAVGILLGIGRGSGSVRVRS
jgi:rod shape determining protein RodA